MSALFPYCKVRGIDCVRVNSKDVDFFVVSNGHRHYAFQLDPPGLAMDNKKLIGILTNPEFLDNRESCKPNIRKITWDEINKTWEDDYGFKVMPCVINMTSWPGIRANEVVRWYFDKVGRTGKTFLINHLMVNDPMSYVSTVIGDYHPMDKFREGSWNGKFWTIEPAVPPENQINFVDKPASMEPTYVNSDMFTFLENCFRLWKEESMKLGMTYWPIMIVMTRAPPQLIPMTFDMELFHIDAETKRLKRLGSYPGSDHH